MTLNKVQSRST